MTETITVPDGSRPPTKRPLAIGLVLRALRRCAARRAVIEDLLEAVEARLSEVKRQEKSLFSLLLFLAD